MDEMIPCGEKKTTSDLHKDFHPVQRGGTGATDSPRRCTCHQVLPPAARALFVLRKFIWDGETVANVQYLETTGVRFLRLSGQYQAHCGAWEPLPPFLRSILTLTETAVAAGRQKEKLGLCANTAARKLAATFFRGVYSDKQTSKQSLHVSGLYQEACWVFIAQQTQLLSACFRQTHPAFFQKHKVPLHCQLNAAPLLSI